MLAACVIEHLVFCPINHLWTLTFNHESYPDHSHHRTFLPDSSCYHHKGKLLMVAICSSMLSDWLFLLACRLTFSSLRLVFVHIALYIRKGLLWWKGVWHSGKTLFSKNYVEVNFRGEMLWMFWRGDAWANFSVTLYSISGYWVLLIVSTFIFCFPPNSMRYLLDYKSHACKSLCHLSLTTPSHHLGLQVAVCLPPVRDIACNLDPRKKR